MFSAVRASLIVFDTLGGRDTVRTGAKGEVPAGLAIWEARRRVSAVFASTSSRLSSISQIPEYPMLVRNLAHVSSASGSAGSAGACKTGQFHRPAPGVRIRPAACEGGGSFFSWQGVSSGLGL